MAPPGEDDNAEVVNGTKNDLDEADKCKQVIMNHISK